ncbi:MAG TPA: biotin/lipoyl-binding protein, partial [Thermoanaerobaculia bacterium]
MKKRIFLMVVAIAVFVTAIGAVKYGQIKKGMAQQASFQPPPEAVTTFVAKAEQWPSTLSAIGTVAAVRGVVVSADLPGIVDKIAFESGQAVKQGDLLVQLDTRQEQAQLAAALAQLELARLNLERMQKLVD